MKLQGSWAIGTVRENRLTGAEKRLKSKKQLLKEGRGNLIFELTLKLTLLFEMAR